MTVVPHVLIVDDDRLTGLAVGFLLESWGLATTVVHTGRTAWEACQRQRFKLVLLDDGLNGERGVHWIPCLRAAAPEARIVLWTGNDPEGYQALLDSRVADGLLHKPAGPEVLRATLQQAGIHPQARGHP